MLLWRGVFVFGVGMRYHVVAPVQHTDIIYALKHCVHIKHGTDQEKSCLGMIQKHCSGFIKYTWISHTVWSEQCCLVIVAPVVHRKHHYVGIFLPARLEQSLEIACVRTAVDVVTESAAIENGQTVFHHALQVRVGQVFSDSIHIGYLYSARFHS